MSRSGLLLPLVALIWARAAHPAPTCSDPPPGTQKMGRGVDITKLDLIPLDAGSNGFKSPVLNFTCVEGKTWKSPQGKEYQLPDQIWHMMSIPRGWLSAEVDLYKTHEDVRQSMATNVGGEGSIWNFAFSASQSYKKMEDTIVNTSRYISDVGSFESATRVDLTPGWNLTLNTYTQMFIDRFLNGTFQANPSGYNRFIETFGTHYFTTANFGGYIRVLTETKTDYFYSSSENEAQTNAKASFLNIISAYGGQVSGSKTVDESFTKSSTQTVRYYGGNTNLLTSSGIKDWQPTVENDPWLFSGELKPVSDLISDETIRTSMEQAVVNFILRSYLGEQERIIASGRTKSTDSFLNTLQERVTTMKNSAELVVSDVEALGRDVEYHLIVPEWFSLNTNLCFKWWADDTPGECGGGADSLLCARPNRMTPVYRDDTDGRSGGCQMQWGIQSNGYPSWFNDVRVCYQWYRDGDAQCFADKSVLCAGVNEYSPAYRDDTHRRRLAGGCQMSWKIEAPDTAPLWMKTVKICFSWYPDGDAGQCGPAPSRDLCAVVNEWTAYYRDDTDGRSGGCRMSWGLKLDF